MEINNIDVSYDINRQTPPKRILVSHVNDVNTRVIELTLTQGDDALAPEPGCTASASIVERYTKALIRDGITCTVTAAGTILIPIDNLHFRNKMDIYVEVSVFDSTREKILALPYPLWIRVNPSILDDAEITEESLGTVPELLEEAKELVENYRYEPTRSELEEIAQMIDVSGKEDTAHKQSSIAGQAQSSDSVNYPNINAVRNYVSAVRSNLEQYIDNEISGIPVTAVDSSFSLSSTNPVQNKVVAGKFNEVISGKADKATTLSGYGITDAYTKSQVDAAIQTAIGGVENGAY